MLQYHQAKVTALLTIPVDFVMPATLLLVLLYSMLFLLLVSVVNAHFSGRSPLMQTFECVTMPCGCKQRHAGLSTNQGPRVGVRIVGVISCLALCKGEPFSTPIYDSLVVGAPKMVPLILGNPKPYIPLYKPL